MIRTTKLEALQVFRSNFKGTPSQEKRKTILIDFRRNKLTLPAKVTLLRSFQLSAMLSVTLTFCNLLTPESQFS
jgi:hypothetical protein